VNRTMKTVPISAYGKLPLSREFLIHACDEKGAQGVTDMLHSAARALADITPRPDALRVYFPLRSGRNCVAMSLWPSSDEGGKRRFPFGMFALPKASASVEHPGFFTSFAALHELHESVQPQLLELPGPREFEQVMARQFSPDRDKDASVRFKDRAGTYPTTRWAAALYGTDARRFVMALWRLKRLADAEQIRRFVGVRLPLVDTHAIETQADAWLGLIARRIGSLPWPSAIAGRFADGTASLVSYFRPLEPNDFSIVSGKTPEGILDLATHKELADQTGFADFVTEMQKRITQTHPTLRELPDILTGL
jgi:hypothetical protein